MIERTVVMLQLIISWAFSPLGTEWYSLYLIWATHPKALHFFPNDYLANYYYFFSIFFFFGKFQSHFIHLNEQVRMIGDGFVFIFILFCKENNLFIDLEVLYN